MFHYVSVYYFLCNKLNVSVHEEAEAAKELLTLSKESGCATACDFASLIGSRYTRRSFKRHFIIFLAFANISQITNV